MLAAQHHRSTAVLKGGIRPCRRLAGLLALALGSGLSASVGAASIEIIGGTFGPPGPSNAAAIDYVLIDDAASVDGDVTNDTTGTVSGDDDHSGIGVYNGSTINGAVTNQGAIGASDLANYAIEIRDSTITGGVSNSGSLASADTAILIDVLFSGGLSGGIGNAGTVSAGGAGIDFQGESLAGGIANSGTISSTLTGISAYLYAGTPDGGTLGEGIVNAGTIGSQDNAGIRVYAGTLTGGVANTDTGRINAPNDDGLFLDIETIEGGVSNAGAIESGGVGVNVRAQSLDGGVTNSGTVTSSDGDGIVLSLAAASGGVLNAGTIVANGGHGMSLSVADLGDGITNTGLIQSIASGIALDSGSAVTGDIHNASDGAIRASVGIDLVDSRISGGIANAGEIMAGSGIAISGGTEVSGDLTNDGTIDADVSIAVSSDSISGDVTNTGTLIGDLSLAGTNASGDGIDLVNSGAIDLDLPSLGLSLVSGDYTQTGAGSLAITLLPFADYVGFAPLTILGDMDIAGDLLLGFDAAFSFVPFERLTLIDLGGVRTGLFDNYDDNALVMGFGGRRGLYIDYTDAGSIDLYTTPLPATWLLIGLGLLGWHALARRGQRAPGRVRSGSG
jgi:hypothetical protein